MKNIVVITGGGSGMGLEAAKLMDKDSHIILMGRTPAKLQNALDELAALGLDAEAFPADAGDAASVEKLAAYAASLGNVKTVIHAAGISPHMASGEEIFRINAIGTINIDTAFLKVMGPGSCILNVASMSAYMLPAAQTPTALYQVAMKDANAFMAGAAQMLGNIPEEKRSGAGYTISKNFMKWYTEHLAVEAGKKGIRIVCISPGTFDTPLGEVEGEGAAKYARMGAMGRVGKPEEIAKMMAFMVSDDASYLTGVDILYDGGTIAAMNAMMEAQAQKG